MVDEKQLDEEKVVEEPVEAEELEPEVFTDLKEFDLLKVFKLYVTNLYDGASKVLYGLLTDTQKTDLTDGGATTLHSHAVPTHKTSHQNGGGDEISVAGLSGELADDQPAKTHALDSHSVPTGSIDMSSQTLYNVQDPTGEADHWAATKGYVDTTLSGIAYLEALASDTLQASANTARDTTGTSYVKVKEITVQYPGEIRIKFDMNASNGNMSARVYKNGVAHGTEQTFETGGSWDTKSEDLSTWDADDLCQLYYKNNTADSANVRNFRLYYDYQIKQDSDNYPAPTIDLN